MKWFLFPFAYATALSYRQPATDPDSTADVASEELLIKDHSKPWELPMTSGPGMRPKHTLRICNAYPFSEPMDLYLNEVELYGGMKYKECDDFVNLNLVPGDNLRFKTMVDHHIHTAGIFEIADLPKYSSTLLLVISRHDIASNSVVFESHVFRHSDDAQIAVVDTFRGRDKARLRILHQNLADQQSEPEMLPFGSVHRINSGSYELVMDEKSMDTRDNIEKPIVALPRHDYVVLRVGIEDPPEPEDGPQEGPNPIPGDKSYTEELIVFPLSDEKRLQPSSKGWFSDWLR